MRLVTYDGADFDRPLPTAVAACFVILTEDKFLILLAVESLSRIEVMRSHDHYRLECMNNILKIVT